jgi:hypothetical protein
MATINATVSVNSNDLTSNTLALSKTMTMTKAGTNTGLELTSGLGLGTSSGSGTPTADSIGGTHLAIGRLYGGDWMLIPFDGSADTGDITVAPSTSEKMTVEYIIFFE